MKNRIKPVHKYAFFSTVIIGIVCYFYTMTHHLLTYDSMWNLVSDQDMISSGRQFLTYACRISSDYDLPALNGLLAILYLAITSVLLVDIFDVDSKYIAVLIGGVIVTFPSVSSTFCYTYTIDGYMMAVLAVTLAFWLADKYKYGFIVSVFLTAFSLGVYQAYYSYLILLCILVLLLRLLKEVSYKVILNYVWKYLVMGIGGYLVYVISLKIMLNISGATVSGYQGTDKVLNFPFLNLSSGLKAAIEDFKMFVRWGHVFTITTSMTIAYVAIIFSAVAIYIFCFIKNTMYKKPFNIVFSILLVAMIPFALELISIMDPTSYVHLLTRFAWVLFFVFSFVLFGRVEIKILKDKVQTILKGLCIVSGTVLIFEFIVMNNIVSFQMEERYEKTYALCLRLVDRLEETDGYQTGDEVAILGGIVNQEYYPPTSVTEEILSAYFGVNGEYCVNSTEKIAEFSKHYLNFSMTTISSEREEILVGTSEYIEMQSFPSSDCVRNIDGVWVIKLN